MSKAYFTNIEDLARFCAQLTRDEIDFEVNETQCAGRYVVEIMR